jgi:hypothetical protein
MYACVYVGGGGEDNRLAESGGDDHRNAPQGNILTPRRETLLGAGLVQLTTTATNRFSSANY